MSTGTPVTAATTPLALTAGAWRRRAQSYVRAVLAGLVITLGAALMTPVGVVTFFRARRAYSWCARWIARAVLAVYGVRIQRHGPRLLGSTQTVYISNHTSTLDLFVLVALGLPNCRFFLSGFLHKLVPLGIISTMMGTFFTVPQSRPAERTRIFQRAAKVLRRTGESVYLSPEGGRIATGFIGPFNKGAFHLAMSLGAPIQPFFLEIPADVDPGLGYNARPGTVHVHTMPVVHTSEWRVDTLVQHKEQVRESFVAFQEELRCGR
ncbi:MAG: 1-acyl-sn-glycerol-3-phosphate acyltransferase [Acidobacteria bacterium]|nr:1-acyl-sn-glycerol-3-phosphate acyltransferase [Acidobacteriota bacterium]MCA1651701.1 1-acyl-sn-glycerol-3-phosphate acyltransferase [Acidobacteriota bacterium]